MLLFYVYIEFFSLFSFFLQITGAEKHISTYLRVGRAIAQAVAACEVCGGQSGTGTSFLRVLRFPLPNIPPISSSS
jgi:hypothetical protein